MNRWAQPTVHHEAWHYRGLPFCKWCHALHDDGTSMVPDLIADSTICRECHGFKGAGHGYRPCRAMKRALALCARGLHSTRRWRGPGDGGVGIVSPARYAADMLRAFDHVAELARSNYTGAAAAVECWTTQAGIDTLLVLQTAARNCLAVCTPVAARLFQAHPETFNEFSVLWRLDAPERALCAVLEPIVTRETKRRRNRPIGE